ncbi:MAG: phage/plasmid primase, P4 family [Nanoarchaeota archaeon]|nr:phage/plasmid primase, P4 family [Nanoarchaeota archaeon]
MAKTYTILKDIEIKKYSTKELLKKLESYIKGEDNSKEKAKDKPVDTSKSGKEWAEICRLVKKGKYKEEIFEEMKAFKKWNEDGEQYREYTYNNAVEEIKNNPPKEKKKRESRSTLSQEQVKELEDKDFKAFCKYVRGLYSSIFPGDRTEGEDLVVKYLMSKYRFLTPEDSKEIFVYDNGIYVSNGEALIGKVVEGMLGIENSNHNVNEVFGHIKRRTYIKREEFVEPLDKICLKNGILNINTLEVSAFTPDIIFLNKITPAFNKEADCPKFKKFLDEVLIKRENWKNLNTDKTDLLTMQEFYGYLLYKKVEFNRAVMLYGEGENGKSTKINVVKKFLGEKNVSNVPIQKLETNNFAVASLHGKLANLHSDLPKTALRETSRFKQITGGDSIDAEKKFRDNFSFLPYAKMMFAANTLPASYDDSKAFWRRWLIFKFPNSFSESSDDTNKNLLGDLTTEEELSGILNWAIEGLKRLLKNKKFTINKSTNEVREEYIRKSDSIGAFILDIVEEVPGSFILKRDLYEVYAQYCRGRAYDMVTENTFHKRFYQKVNVREYHPKVKGEKKQKAAWSGIKFKDKPADYEDDGAEGSFENEDSDIDDWVN